MNKRINEIISSLAENEGIFKEMAEFFDEVTDFYNDIKDGSAFDKTPDELKERNNRLYAPLLSYEKTYLYPPRAKETYGEETGRLLSGLFSDMIGLNYYAARGDEEKIIFFAELAFKVCEIFKNTPDDKAAAIHSVIEEAYLSNLKAFTDEGIKENLVCDKNDTAHRLCASDRDFSDISYLYEYGLYIGDNERGLARYMASLSEKEIRDMAATYVNGYIKGFEVTRRDITKKSIVKCEYPIGMERMIAAAVTLFAEHNIKCTFPVEKLFSFTGRTPAKRNVRSVGASRAYYFDHKDDMGMYASEAMNEARLEALKSAYEKYKHEASLLGGPALIEHFGEANYNPDPKAKNYSFNEENRRLNVEFASKSSVIAEQYMPSDETSFTIISYPLPEIGDDFEEIFKETIIINTLDYERFVSVQQYIIDALDKGEYVEVVGNEKNVTDMKVMLHTLENPGEQTNFENCVADVNIPVGEVFTSPVLEGTNGTLFVSHVFLNGFEFKDLRLEFKDGKITDYECRNFADSEANRRYIEENILFSHKTLPIGEFAIGTNTYAYRMARKYDIEDVLPILIMEKTGPHFAVGDTCYSHGEDVPMYNPDGKECIARDNSCSILRLSEDEDEQRRAYFNCHTDITIPFDELKRISVVEENGQKTDIIRDGKFVLYGTEELNEALMDS